MKPLYLAKLNYLIALVIIAASVCHANELQRKITSHTGKRKLAYNKPVGDDSEPIRHDGISRGKTNGKSVDLYALAPNHVGSTTYENPTLYWYQSATSDAKVEIGISRNDQNDPILEIEYNEKNGPGIHKIELAKHKFKIEKNVEYEWFVSIIKDTKDHSKDIVASGAIKRIAPPKSVAANLLTNNAEDLIYTFAEAGIWYDALELVSKQIEQHPDNTEYRELRAELLEQGDLIEVAEFDRNAK